MKKAYEKLPGLGGAARKFLRVVPMYLSQKDLNISMTKTLMGVGGRESAFVYRGMYWGRDTGSGKRLTGTGCHQDPPGNGHSVPGEIWVRLQRVQAEA